ncbi:MAG: M42 family metallopeptidase [Candidatus Hodarchaeota archaeon]
MERLLAATGVSGFEAPIREIIQEIVHPHLALETDSLGNLYGSIGDGSPHILIIAHMDELGLVVTHIEENGCLRFRKVGGIDDRLLPSRSVFVHTKSGPIRGAIGMVPPHLMVDRGQMKNVVPWNEMQVDLCTRSRAETEALGVRLLDPITLEKDSFVLQGKYLCGRGIDDRFGCAVLVKLVESLTSQQLNRKITFVWSAQEEIGLHGATVIGNRFTPDIVVAVDSYATGDAPDVPFHLAPVRLGDGPVLRLWDHRAIASPYMRDQFETIAKQQGLPLQCGATGGGTDGAAIQRAGTGALMMAVSVAVRYLHSTVEICHLDDLQNLVTLLNIVLPQLQLPQKVG